MYPQATAGCSTNSSNTLAMQTLPPDFLILLRDTRGLGFGRAGLETVAVAGGVELPGLGIE
jgi:hypothetical protein